MESDHDYVTMNPAVAYNKWNVVVMRWDSSHAEYVVFRVSEQLTRPAARSLMLSWAAAGHLEVRCLNV